MLEKRKYNSKILEIFQNLKQFLGAIHFYSLSGSSCCEIKECLEIRFPRLVFKYCLTIRVEYHTIR